MTYKTRVWIVIAIALAGGVSTLFLNPIPQDPAYHLFADARGWLGIPNVANVVSNAAFVVVGIVGLFVLYGKGIDRGSDVLANSLPYAVFFVAVVLVGAGSAYYHWRPDNRTLFWDRLPMTIGFMALTAAVIADRIHRAAGLRIFLPVLLALGIASLIYWSETEAAGRGDLRPYGLVQFLPILLIPVICWLFPRGRYTRGRYIAGMILCYGLAKLFELYDVAIYDLLGGWLSGHTLKHLAAAAATALVIPMWLAGRWPDR
jgi:hypothetical protein